MFVETVFFRFKGLYLPGQLFYSIVIFDHLQGPHPRVRSLNEGVGLFLLWRHRHEDVNMSSVWECSRNDIASNLSVFIAAGAVWLTGAGWPDLVVAAGLTLLLLRSASRVISSALAELRAAD